MKKILLVTLEHPPQIGGIATYCHTLALALPHDRVVVLAPAGSDPSLSEAKKNAWDKQQPYAIVRKRLFFPKWIWPRWLPAVWHVFQLVRKERIDIVFVHHVLPVGYAAIIAEKFLHVPFLLFSHGTDLLAGTRSAWKKKMVAAVSRRSLGIIFNSESLKRRFLRVLPDYEKKSLVLYPCPDPAFLSPPAPERLEALRSQYALEGKQVLLSISRLDEGKGFPHLIGAFPEILSRNPNLVWFIIGDGPKKEQILAGIRKHNLQNVVRFIGEIPHIDLHPYYYLADLFVLLTHPDEGREEGLGLVFLEASAAGLPIVAGRSGGVEEAVLHGQTGIVVESRNMNEVAETILHLLNNSEAGRQLGEAAKHRIQSEFLWPQQMKKIDSYVR